MESAALSRREAGRQKVVSVEVPSVDLVTRLSCLAIYEECEIYLQYGNRNL